MATPTVGSTSPSVARAMARATSTASNRSQLTVAQWPARSFSRVRSESGRKRLATRSIRSSSRRRISAAATSTVPSVTIISALVPSALVRKTRGALPGALDGPFKSNRWSRARGREAFCGADAGGLRAPDPPAGTPWPVPPARPPPGPTVLFEAGVAWWPGSALATYTPMAPTARTTATPIPPVIVESRPSASSRRAAAMCRRWAALSVRARATVSEYGRSLTPT